MALNNQHLITKPKSGNLFDTYAIGLLTKIGDMIEPLLLVGRLAREISRFCKVFFDNVGHHKSNCMWH